MLKIDKFTTKKNEAFIIECFLDNKEDEDLLMEVLYTKVMYEFFNNPNYSYYIEDLRDFIVSNNVKFKFGNIRNFIWMGLKGNGGLFIIFKEGDD
jgi:hypothetical protein